METINQTVEWRTIPGFNFYEISTEGKIRVKKTKRQIATSINNCGYEIATLRIKPNVLKCTPVHRLVAQTFIPNPDNYTDVDHIDSHRLHNNVWNLQWLSHKDNCRKAARERKYDLGIAQAISHGANIYIGTGDITEFCFISCEMNTPGSYYFMYCKNFIKEYESLCNDYPQYNFELYLYNNGEGKITGKPKNQNETNR